MAISYLPGFDPIWTVLDNFGRPNAGGRLWTYDSENISLLKPTYSVVQPV